MAITLPYTVLFDESDARPLVDVSIDGLGLAVPGLVDSGAINTVFSEWHATEAGIDLSSVEPHPIGVGGTQVLVRDTAVTLEVDEWRWEAEVAFADQWSPPYVLLGHDAFLRYFTVIFRAADLEFDLEFIDR